MTMTILSKKEQQFANRLAHRLALQYENRVCEAMFTKLYEIADAGATHDEIIRTLKKIEAEPSTLNL